MARAAKALLIAIMSALACATSSILAVLIVGLGGAEAAPAKKPAADRCMQICAFRYGPENRNTYSLCMSQCASYYHEREQRDASKPRSASPILARRQHAVPELKEQQQPKFDPTQIAALLDKHDAQRQPSLGFANAQPAQLSQSELDALRRRLSECWSPPVGAANAPNLKVVLRVLFNRDGSVASAPVLAAASSSPHGPAIAESAKRAVLSCQPFTMLRPENYEQWKDIEITFDPGRPFRSGSGAAEAPPDPPRQEAAPSAPQSLPSVAAPIQQPVQPAIANQPQSSAQDKTPERLREEADDVFKR